MPLSIGRSAKCTNSPSPLPPTLSRRYADALASKAYHGYEGFCRQDYIGGDYGLLDCSTGAPLPDYWTALLFGTTMGPRVLEVELAAVSSTSSVKVYAHCTAAGVAGNNGEGGTGSGGSVTVLVINLSNVTTVVSLGASSVITREYVLTPSDDASSSLTGEAGVMGTGIMLNGKELRVGGDGSIPAVAKQGRAVGKGETSIPPTSVSFLVVAGAGHPACK